MTIILFKIWPTNRFSKAKSYNFHFIKTMSDDLLVQMAYYRGKESNLRKMCISHQITPLFHFWILYYDNLFFVISRMTKREAHQSTRDWRVSSLLPQENTAETKNDHQFTEECFGLLQNFTLCNLWDFKIDFRRIECIDSLTHRFRCYVFVNELR